jgi:hypothetical protein
MSDTCPQIYVHVVFAVEYDRKYIFKTDEHRRPKYAAPTGLEFVWG